MRECESALLTTTHRVTVPARFIDAEVVHHVLEGLTAIDPEMARAVIEKSQLEHATEQRARARQRLDAQEDVDRLRRAVVNMPPELQDARADLLKEYDAAARRLNELGREGVGGEPLPVALTQADIKELVDRSKNVRQLWTAPRRTAEDHKRVLRIVISEIVVRRADRESADIELVWQGGLRESLRVRRPRGVDTFVLERTLQGQSPARIVSELNATGTVTASGRPISANVIQQKLGRQGLRLTHERARARQIIRQGLLDNSPRPEILHQLQEQAPRLGPWDPQRLSEAIRQLRRETRSVDALPAVLPAEAERQRAIVLIEQALVARKRWTTIAAELNQAGLRPPRSQSFTPGQVRLLYMRAHGLRSFRLPTGPSASEADSA